MNYMSAHRVRSIMEERDTAIFQLGDTDTAWNPEATKEFIEGPGRIKYVKGADGAIKLSR
jgi:hypothetical protein